MDIEIGPDHDVWKLDINYNLKKMLADGSGWEAAFATNVARFSIGVEITPTNDYVNVPWYIKNTDNKIYRQLTPGTETPVDSTTTAADISIGPEGTVYILSMATELPDYGGYAVQKLVDGEFVDLPDSPKNLKRIQVGLFGFPWVLDTSGNIS